MIPNIDQENRADNDCDHRSLTDGSWDIVPISMSIEFTLDSAPSFR